MISRQKSQFYVAILRPQALLRHTNVAQERNQKLCLLYEIDGNVCLHREGKVLETGLSKKLRLDASKNRGLELACLENPVWENETPTYWPMFAWSLLEGALCNLGPTDTQKGKRLSKRIWDISSWLSQ